MPFWFRLVFECEAVFGSLKACRDDGDHSPLHTQCGTIRWAIPAREHGRRGLAKQFVIDAKIDRLSGQAPRVCELIGVSESPEFAKVGTLSNGR